MIGLDPLLRHNPLIRFSVSHRIHAVATLLIFLLSGCGGEDTPRAGRQSAKPDTVAEDPTTTDSKRRILFFGDSITAGYGVDPDDAYPAIIQDMIDDNGWPFIAVNGGLSGETSAGGLRRIDWMLRQPVDVFVLELGGNDGLRGVAVGATRSNLKAIIEKVREKYPDAAVVVAGMRLPPNLGRPFTNSFADIFPEVAEETGSELIPFIGEDVIGRDRYIQMDGIHPNASGHEVIAETVWEYLEPILEARLEPAS
jgi:acyl-CoA thioesterase-1